MSRVLTMYKLHGIVPDVYDHHNELYKTSFCSTHYLLDKFFKSEEDALQALLEQYNIPFDGQYHLPSDFFTIIKTYRVVHDND